MSISTTAKSEYEENMYLLDKVSNDDIKKRIDNNLRWYITQAVKAKKWYYIFSATTIIAPIISSTIIILNANDAVKNIVSASILALSTISASFLNLFDVKTKWNLYRNQAEEIKRFLIDFSVSEEKSDTELLKAIEGSIRKTDKKWTENLKKE